MLYNETKPEDMGETGLARRGYFITFEGIDGSGKTTQINRLTEYLTQVDIPVVRLREPGGTAIGEAVRDILLDHKHTDMHLETELLLFAAARAQLVREIIIPALSDGQWIICDRYYDSTIAYQGYGRGLNIDMIKSINQLASAGHRPDKTFILDLPVETACARLAGRLTEADRIDCESLSFMERTKAGYLAIAEEEPDRVTLVDAELEEEELAHSIISVLREGFGI